MSNRINTQKVYNRFIDYYVNIKLLKALEIYKEETGKICLSSIEIKKLTSPIKYKLKTQIPYKKFKQIIELYNDMMMHEILMGNKMHLGQGLGHIYIIELERKIKKSASGNYYTYPNWNASLTLKQKLIDEGKIPFETIKDKEGNIIGNNGGENWMVYYDDKFICKFYWSKGKKGNNIVIKNVNRYIFKPTGERKVSIKEYKEKFNINYTKNVNI